MDAPSLGPRGPRFTYGLRRTPARNFSSLVAHRRATVPSGGGPPIQWHPRTASIAHPPPTASTPGMQGGVRPPDSSREAAKRCAVPTSDPTDNIRSNSVSGRGPRSRMRRSLVAAARGEYLSHPTPSLNGRLSPAVPPRDRRHLNRAGH